MGSVPRGISGSRAAAILGLGQYEGQTAFTVWQQIEEERRPGFNAERGYLLPEPPDNAAIRWGTAFEDAIVELAEAKQGKPIGDLEDFWSVNEGRTVRLRGLEHGNDAGHYITCHIDGRYHDGPDLLSLHEGKTTNLFSFRELWGEPGTDRVPSGYQVQGQHQMLCTGAEQDIFSVLVFPRRPEEWEAEGIRIEHFPKAENGIGENWLIDKDGWPDTSYPSAWARVIAEMGLFYQYPVHAVSALQADMVERYRDFWNRFVIPEKEPPINCYEDLKRSFKAPKGTVVADEQIERWAAEWKMIAEEIGDSGSLARRREELKVMMLSYMRSHDSIIDDESREKTILVDRQGRKLAQFNGKVFR